MVIKLLLYLFLTPPIKVYPATHVRKIFVTSKCWQNFILNHPPPSPLSPIVMGGGRETMYNQIILHVLYLMWLEHLVSQLGWLAHLVSRFACNTRVIVDVSSNPPNSNVKSLQQKLNINSSSKQTNIASTINHSNGNSIRW